MCPWCKTNNRIDKSEYLKRINCIVCNHVIAQDGEESKRAKKLKELLDANV